MNLQKTKSSSKKLKQIKSQAKLQFPLTPLIQQINQLKHELASMKSKRTVKSGAMGQQEQSIKNRDTYTDMIQLNSQNENKPISKIFNKTTNIETLRELVLPLREQQLKINIQISKLNANLKQNDPKNASNTFNKIILYINKSIEQLCEQNRKAILQISQQANKQENIYKWKQQAKVYQQFSNQLQKQNIQYKHLLAKQVDQIDQLQAINDEIKQQYDLLNKTSIGLQRQLDKLKLICDGMREQREQLEEKLKIYEKSIEKKQSQLLMLSQDVHYNRMQAEKNKTQKRQIQKMYDNLLKQYKQMKAKNQIELDSLLKQKNKWRQQCENRRVHDSQSLNYEDQKNKLKKQIQNMRSEVKDNIQQINSLKLKLQQQQKYNYTTQQQNYKLTIQNEKLVRSIQYCKSQIQQLRNQMQELRVQSNRFKQLAIKSKVGISNINKVQALDEIQQLIKLHKQQQL